MEKFELNLLDIEKELAETSARIDANIASIREEVARREAEFLAQENARMDAEFIAQENARFCREIQMTHDEANELHQQMVIDHMSIHQNFNF